MKLSCAMAVVIGILTGVVIWDRQRWVAMDRQTSKGTSEQSLQSLEMKTGERLGQLPRSANVMGMLRATTGWGLSAAPAVQLTHTNGPRALCSFIVDFRDGCVGDSDAVQKAR